MTTAQATGMYRIGGTFYTKSDLIRHVYFRLIHNTAFEPLEDDYYIVCVECPDGVIRKVAEHCNTRHLLLFTDGTYISNR